MIPLLRELKGRFLFVVPVCGRDFSLILLRHRQYFPRNMKYLSLLVTGVAMLRSIANAEPEVNLVNVVLTSEDVKDAYAYAKEKVPEKARGMKNALRKKLLVHLGAAEFSQVAQTVPGLAVANAAAANSDSESELDPEDEYAGRYNSRRIKAGRSPYVQTEESEDESDHSI